MTPVWLKKKKKEHQYAVRTGHDKYHMATNHLEFDNNPAILQTFGSVHIPSSTWKTEGSFWGTHTSIICCIINFIVCILSGFFLWILLKMVPCVRIVPFLTVYTLHRSQPNAQMKSSNGGSLLRKALLCLCELVDSPMKSWNDWNTWNAERV